MHWWVTWTSTEKPTGRRRRRLAAARFAPGWSWQILTRRELGIRARVHSAGLCSAAIGGALDICFLLPRLSVLMEGRSQVGGALLENTDKHGEAEVPEKPARRFFFARG